MSADPDIQVVTFGLGAEVFAVPVNLVREILDARDTFRLPNGPDYLRGLTDVRGQGVTTISLRLRFGLPEVEDTSSTRILVVDVPLADRTLVLGLVVDHVLNVSNYPSDGIEHAPDIGVPWPSEYISGVIRRPEGFAVLLDMTRIFSSDEVVALQAPAVSAA
jgi:purine-binding chemotaxis protein CheW